MVDDKIDDEEQMYFVCWPFQWPWGDVDAMPRGSSNAASPGLYCKAPDVAIGQLLAPYCPPRRPPG